MEKPKAGEDVRVLHRYVSDLVEGINGLLGMSVEMQGRVSGAGGLSVIGNLSLMRIIARGVGGGSIFVKLDTIVAVGSSKNPSDLGEAVSFVASVTAGATGAIQFIIDGAGFGVFTVPPSGVVVSGSTTALNEGSHTVQAVYSGDARYNPAIGVMIQSVNGANDPIMTLQSNANPCVEGFNLAWTAIFQPQSPIPPAPNITGTVQFFIDGNPFGGLAGVFPASGGLFKATSNSENNLSPGQHVISARYGGDSHYGVNQAQLVQFVKARSVVSIDVNPSEAKFNISVTLTATVEQTLGAVPTGTVQFRDQNGNLGSPVPLDGTGTAVLVLNSGTTEATFNMVADYSGDSKYSPGSDSAPLVVSPGYPVDFSFFWVLGSSGLSAAVDMGVIRLDASAAYTGNVKLALYLGNGLPFMQCWDINTNALKISGFVQTFYFTAGGGPVSASPWTVPFVAPMTFGAWVYYLTGFDIGTMYATGYIDLCVLNLDTGNPVRLADGNLYHRFIYTTRPGG